MITFSLDLIFFSHVLQNFGKFKKNESKCVSVMSILSHFSAVL